MDFAQISSPLSLASLFPFGMVNMEAQNKSQ